MTDPWSRPTRRGRRRVRAALVAATLAIVATACEPAPPGTDFTVNSAGDGRDGRPGDGVCRTDGANPRCTLRAAVEEAEANGVINDIIYVPSGTYSLSLGDIVITTSMQVVGAGPASTTIRPVGRQRAFTIGNSAGARPVATVRRLTVSGARLDSTSRGGALVVYAGASANVFDVVFRDNHSGLRGGAIYNQGNLHLRRSEVSDNQIGLGATIGGGVQSTGGGIFSSGRLMVIDSTIARNKSSRGGGIANLGGHVDVSNSTISGNEVFEGGGGIYNAGPAAVLNIASSTVTQNEAFATLGGMVRPWGGGVLNVDGQVNMGKSVIAGNTDNRWDFMAGYSPDCYSVERYRFTSHRSNLIGILTDNCVLRDSIYGDTRWIAFGGSRDPLDPELGPLGANGGPTRTHQPSRTSPLVDMATAGTSAALFDCPAADQRGIARPLDGDANGVAACDIGAVERSPGG